MDLQQRINSFGKLGDRIRKELLEADSVNGLHALLTKAYQKNAWFTRDNVIRSLQAVATWLEKPVLEKWASAYDLKRTHPKNVGVIMAGNIPLVGFHDFLSVLISGNNILIKCSSEDDVLLPAIIQWLMETDTEWNEGIKLVSKLENPDAVIATGSNNSARYFEYYFGKYPNIIRKNRNSVAILNGDESRDELVALGEDIFSYFGLGCRNVSKLYIPTNYKFDVFFESMQSHSEVMSHNKYMNNYDYHHSVFLLNNVTFLTNNFLIVKEHEALPTPVSVLHYEYYNNYDHMKSLLAERTDEIQCVTGHGFIPFGETQQPELTDYADGVDVLKFLSSI